MAWDQYAAAWAVRHGGYDVRRASPPVRGWLRLGYGLARVLAAVRVRPATVTLAGLGLAAAVPFATGRGPVGLLAAAGLVLLSTLAGAVARALAVLVARASTRTTIREAVADRLGEVAWLAGFWAAGVPAPLVVAGGGLAGLYEYVRGLAFAAGTSRIGAQTAGDRATRAAVAVAGLAVAGLGGLAGLTGAGWELGSGVLTVTMVAWLLVTVLGLGQLAGALHRSLP